MLDSAHSLTLRAVAAGDHDDSPALRNLVASGLVEEQAEGRYAITPAGRVALEDDEPKGWERAAWIVLSVCISVLGIGVIIEWLS